MSDLLSVTAEEYTGVPRPKRAPLPDFFDVAWEMWVAMEAAESSEVDGYHPGAHAFPTTWGPP